METLYSLLQTMQASGASTKTGYQIESLQENPPLDAYDDYSYDLTLKNVTSELIMKIDWYPDGIDDNNQYRIRHLFVDEYFKDKASALDYLNNL